MSEYLAPVLFLVVVFVAFALLHGDRRCIGCRGDCDESDCKKNN